jgi:hypothetical protein
MINGRFVCYGNPTSLNDTFSHGYLITIKHTAVDIQDKIKAKMPYLELDDIQFSNDFDLES